MGKYGVSRKLPIQAILVTAVLITVAVICFYGSYSFGQASFELSHMQTLTASESTVRELRTRNRLCEQSLQQHKAGVVPSEQMNKNLRSNIASLNRSALSFKALIAEYRDNLLRCQARVAKMDLAMEGVLVDVGESPVLKQVRSTIEKQNRAARALGPLPDVRTLLEQRKQLKRALTALASPTQNKAAICPADGELYTVVFDIGSTGNRVHAFKFQVRPGVSLDAYAHPSMSQLELVDSLFRFNEVGLSKFDQPEEAVASLDALFAMAEAYVPAAHHRCTTVQFKATAGLRKVSRPFAEAVLNGIHRRFSARHTLWLRGASPAAILEGGDEGPLAWITVNYLTGNFRTDGPGAGQNTTRAAIIDLGGGSAQIVFEPPLGTLDDQPLSLQFKTSLEGIPIDAYQHSYEGLGLIAATEQLMDSVLGKCGLEPPGAAPYALDSELDADEQTHQAELHEYYREHFPCFPVGYREATTGVSHEGPTRSDVPTDNETEPRGAEFDACAELFRVHVLRDWVTCRSSSCGVWGVYQPSLESFKGDVFAFSFVYDLLKPFFDVNATVGRFTLAQIRSAGHDVCNALTVPQIEAERLKMSASERPRALQPQRMCMYHAYAYALLKHGVRVPESAAMRVEKKINGFETSWALGAALREMG